MILYLLVCLLVFGGVKSQNVTEESRSREENRTLTAHNGSVNVTSSVSKDDTGLIEEELSSNQTSVFGKVDDEDFQDQETRLPGSRCVRAELLLYGRTVCAARFHQQMSSISAENWCELEKVIRPYSELAECLEELCRLVYCFYPNPDVQDFFINVHSLYFHNCTDEPLDAPHWLTVTLTLVPVSLIPALVSLLVYKSKVKE